MTEECRFLQHRTAIVTGGGRGIGRATAIALAEAGASRVTVLARPMSQLEATVAAIEGAGAVAVALPVDLLDLDALTIAAD